MNQSEASSICKSCQLDFAQCKCVHDLTSVLGCTINTGCQKCCYADKCPAKKEVKV